MRAWSVGLVAGIVCGVLGYVAGTRAAGAPAAATAPVPRGEPASKLPALRGLVCASTQRPDAGESEDCDAIDLRARWCEGELAEARRERQAVREPWPEATPSEAPERWTATVEEALETCALGAELELVDCTEYPCTAALRPAVPPPTPEAFEHEMERLMEVARGCAPLREAFGIDDTMVTGAIDVYRLDARCDGEREDFFVLAALDPEGPAYAMLNENDRSDQEDRDFNRWLYRRADDLSAMWPCP